MPNFIYYLQDIEVDERNATVKKDGETINLSGKSFDLLLSLLKASPNLLSHDEIMKDVWRNRIVNDETIKQNISRIRSALSDSYKNPIYLSSVRGKGYKCLGKVEKIDQLKQNHHLSKSNGVNKNTMLYIVAGVSILLLLVINLMYFTYQNKIKILNHRLIVLPFKTLNQDSSDDYLAKGLTEEFTSSLARLNNLKVLDQSSINSFKHSNYSILEIYKKLNLSVVLDGSIRRMNDRVRIYIKLINANTQEHYWSKEFDRPYNELFDIRHEVIKNISQTLFPEKPINFNKISTNNISAYDDLLKGQAEYREYTVDSNNKAIVFFQRAVKRDSNYSNAYAWLANAYAMKSTHTLNDVYATKAIETARHSLVLNPNSALANKAIGIALSNQGKYKQSIQNNVNTVRMRPEFAAAINNLASVYMDTGHFDLASEQYKILIDNYTDEIPYISMVYAHYAKCMIVLGYLNVANNYLEKAIELDPSHPEVMLVQNMYLIEKESFSVALIKSEEFIKINQDCMYCILVAADNQYLAGNYEKALKYYNMVFQEMSVAEMSAAIQIAIIKKMNGNVLEAAKILKAVEVEELTYIKTGHEDWTHFMKLGDISAINNNNQDAYNWYVKAVEAGYYYKTGFDLNPILMDFRKTAFYDNIIQKIRKEINDQKYHVKNNSIHNLSL